MSNKLKDAQKFIIKALSNENKDKYIIVEVSGQPYNWYIYSNECLIAKCPEKEKAEKIVEALKYQELIEKVVGAFNH